MTFEPVYVYYMPEREKMETNKIYISHEFGSTIHICPCGCGTQAVCSFKPQWRNGWDLTEKDGKVTLSPSILNRGCNTHYYIRDNELIYA